MRRPLNTTLRLGAVLAFGSVLAIGGAVHAQVDASISGTIAVTPPSTPPGTVVQAVAEFQSSGDFTANWDILVDIGDTGGAGTLANIVGGPNTSGCNINAAMTIASCAWLPLMLNEATSITVDIVVAANATPASPGWVVRAFVVEETLASTNLEILGPPPTDPPPTDPPPTDPPGTDPPVTDPPSGTDPAATDPTVTDPSATDPPVTGEPGSANPGTGNQGGVSPDLPTTGNNGSVALVAVLALAGGLALVLIARRPAKS